MVLVLQTGRADGVRMDEILIFWGIHTLDRTKANPFPLEYRDWYLQWDLVPEAEKNQILEILQPKQKLKNQLEPEPNTGDEEWSLSLAKPDARILAFRKYFVQRAGFDINECLKDPTSKIKHFLPINLHFEYFEDETGRPISKIEIHQFKTGEANPIIPFEPRSVLRLGPAPLREAKLATQEDSETIAHFLEMIDLLSNSSWYRLAPALTFRTRNESAEVDSLFPDVHETQGVVLAIRQLYSSDNLFNRAVNCHAKLCGDSKKVDWVGTIKKQFNDFLDSPNSFPMLYGVTVRELMDLFLYGGKFAHANQTDKQQKLHALILAHGRAQVVMAVQTSFRRVVDSARLVYPVLMQDYFHWLAAGKCPKPPPMALMNQLLFSGREQVHIKKVKK